MSDTDFVDSISLTLAPATTSRPTSGSCTNTTSPRLSWAKSVIPMRAVSPSSRTHSCSRLYRSPSGMFIRQIVCIRRRAERHGAELQLPRELGDVARVDGNEATGLDVARTFGPDARDRKLRTGE